MAGVDIVLLTGVKMLPTGVNPMKADRNLSRPLPKWTKMILLTSHVVVASVRIPLYREYFNLVNFAKPGKE